MELVPISQELNEMLNGQTRLEELREKYDGPGFEKAVIQLVEQGEIALIPIEGVVHIRTE